MTPCPAISVAAAQNVGATIQHLAGGELKNN
jgi:hypothetical protein